MTTLALTSLARLALTGGLLLAAVALGAWIYRRAMRDALAIADRPTLEREGGKVASEPKPRVEIAEARTNAAKGKPDPIPVNNPVPW